MYWSRNVIVSSSSAPVRRDLTLCCPLRLDAPEREAEADYLMEMAGDQEN